jgi:tetratricopeptide (TPR) repeat protein
MTGSAWVDAALRRARAMVSRGDEAAARQAYFDILRADPADCAALTELDALAHAGGFLSAAREAYRQAVRCHPESTLAQAGYATLLSEAGEAAAARAHYQAALAIAPDWKVPYFTAAMAANPGFREEVHRFLAGMPAVLGARAMAALQTVQAMLELDYAGIDFALTPDGSLLLFEANATMAIIPPDTDPVWDYRRPAVDAALTAARGLLPQHGKPS